MHRHGNDRVGHRDTLLVDRRKHLTRERLTEGVSHRSPTATLDRGNPLRERLRVSAQTNSRAQSRRPLTALAATVAPTFVLRHRHPTASTRVAERFRLPTIREHQYSGVRKSTAKHVRLKRSDTKDRTASLAIARMIADTYWRLLAWNATRVIRSLFSRFQASSSRTQGRILTPASHPAQPAQSGCVQPKSQALRLVKVLARKAHNSKATCIREKAPRRRENAPPWRE